MVKRSRLLDSITYLDRCLFLAYDQGLEHGPVDFNDKNVDPNYVIDIAQKGRYNGVILQKGIAEKYYDEIKRSDVPLIIKLNGKTNLVYGDPVSRQLCTVEEAVKLDAKAVGYTIYIGSEHEAEMMQEFESIRRDASVHNLPVILWAYPRGRGVKGRSKKELLSYSTRVGLELGADIIKVHWDSTLSDLRWAVTSAARARVVVAGGAKRSEYDLLCQVRLIMESGCIGLAIGRNIWQSKDPLLLTNKIKEIIWKKS